MAAYLVFRTNVDAGVISHGNAVPIVKAFKNALSAALRTIFRPKKHRIAEFCIYNLKIFPGVIPQIPTEVPRGARSQRQFPLGSPAFPLIPFHETTTALTSDCVKNCGTLGLRPACPGVS